jgi:hypothetical protein
MTKKAIQDDIAFIIDTLKHKEVTIPSFLSCAVPGLAVIFGMPLWQFFIAYDMSTFKPTNQMDSLPSIGFSLFLGFLLFIVITGMRSKYLSLPTEIRDSSLIVNIINRKVKLYTAAWIGINILTGITIKLLALSAALSYGMQFASLVILWFIALVDLSRYDLAVFSSVIKAWREGDKLDPDLLKNEHS